MYPSCNLSVKVILVFQFAANYFILFYNADSYELLNLIL
jgi:hypothetical protein